MTSQQKVHDPIPSVLQRLIEKYDPGNSRAGRMELACHVSFMDGQGFGGEGRVLDISIHGCRMVSAECPQVGKFLKVSICLPKSNRSSSH